MLNTIPEWNAQGVVPPYLEDATSFDRSPYVASLKEFVQRYAISSERIAILHGFLKFRAAIRDVGLVEGFQWVNGSFLESKELLRKEDPGDIDVVTFYRLPPNTTQEDLFARNSLIFARARHEECKEKLRVDRYFQSLSDQTEYLIFMSNYWYGMWSHQRDSDMWKGFVQIPLDTTHDSSALDLLQNKGGETL